MDTSVSKTPRRKGPPLPSPLPSTPTMEGGQETLFLPPPPNPDVRRAGLTRTALQFEDTPPSQPLSQNTSRTTTPRGSADSSRQGSRHTSAERPALEATPTEQIKNTHMLPTKVTTFANPMERSASLQDVASTSYATIAGSHHQDFIRDPRLRARAQATTESRGPFDKAHRSPVKIPEVPKAFCRPPKRRQDSDEEGKITGRSTRQKTEVGAPSNRSELDFLCALPDERRESQSGWQPGIAGSGARYIPLSLLEIFTCKNHM
ncbi:hypothetical protein ACJJTC_002603 [Scirpophaga incertulas]